MQVVSGPIGRERVHYEAPAADDLTSEMKAFLDWFDGTRRLDPVLKAALAHLWFVTIHPFEDGNGRIARAIADMALARSEAQPAALLQHVRADPAGAERLLRHPRSDPEGRAGHHALAGMVPGVPGPRLRRARGTSSPTCSRQGALLGEATARQRSTSASGSCSIACSMASKANSRPRNGPSSRSARRIPRCATSTNLSSVACWSRIPKAAAAPATH